jgi:flagellar biosynthetic protein FliQ
VAPLAVAAQGGVLVTESSTLSILSQTLIVIAEISAPILLVALVVGLVISIFQAVTQVNESTLSYVPKIAAIAAVLIIAGPWMLQTLLDYATRIFSSLPNLVQ